MANKNVNLLIANLTSAINQMRGEFEINYSEVLGALTIVEYQILKEMEAVNDDEAGNSDSESDETNYR